MPQIDNNARSGLESSERSGDGAGSSGIRRSSLKALALIRAAIESARSGNPVDVEK